MTDPYTAVVLKGLFEALMDEGGVLVCTSNRAPDELPRQGLHEDLFSHFVSHVRRHCREVLTTGVDYRRVLADEAIDIGEGDRESKSLAPGRFFCPLDETASQAMDREWGDAVAREGTGAQAAALDVPVMFGRTLRAERRVGGVARFSFAELCDRALGACRCTQQLPHFSTMCHIQNHRAVTCRSLSPCDPRGRGLCGAGRGIPHRLCGWGAGVLDADEGPSAPLHHADRRALQREVRRRIED